MPVQLQPEEPIVTKRDFNDIDSLISEVLSQPKQVIGTPPPDPSNPAGANVGSPSFPDSGEAIAPPWEGEPAEPMDPEEAKRSGLRLAKTLDGIISMGASAYAKEKDRKKYQASEGEINDLADPLGELSQKYNFNLSPEVRALFLIVTTYWPKLLEASNDRRINLLNDRIAELESKERERENRLADLERRAAAKEAELSSK